MQKNKLIHARLILAQQLLEEADALPGAEGYHVDKADDFVHHSRHEREALVVYLLLTCFDLLGQSRKFITFYEWLSSNKAEIHSEHKEAIKSIAPKANDAIGNSKALHEYYNKIYGPTRAFYSGIESLPKSALAHLLSSLIVSRRNPESLKVENRNTMYPALPINSKAKEKKLKLAFLYSQRNAFTHKLLQNHTSSNPGMSCLANNFSENQSQPAGGSWTIWILGGHVSYGSSLEHEPKHTFTTRDWPFVLFEVLYSAIGKQFDRTNINLKFSIIDTDKNKFFPQINHRDLPAFLEAHSNIKLTDWGLKYQNLEPDCSPD